MVVVMVSDKSVRISQYSTGRMVIIKTPSGFKYLEIVLRLSQVTSGDKCVNTEKAQIKSKEWVWNGRMSGTSSVSLKFEEKPEVVISFKDSGQGSHPKFFPFQRT